MPQHSHLTRDRARDASVRPMASAMSLKPQVKQVGGSSHDRLTPQILVSSAGEGRVARAQDLARGQARQSSEPGTVIYNAKPRPSSMPLPHSSSESTRPLRPALGRGAIRHTASKGGSPRIALRQPASRFAAATAMDKALAAFGAPALQEV